MKNKRNSISRILYRAVDLDLDFDKIFIPKYITTHTQTGLSSIKNAWQKYAVIDNVGCVWVQTKGLKSILRLGRNYKEFILFNISENHKRNIEGKPYVRVDAIGAELISNISSHQYELSKRNYSKYSLEILKALNENPLLDSIRENQRQLFLKSKNKLKQKRINEFGLINDELTGEKLEIRKCEFSHIRSIASYPDLALYTWNGLIVNQQTHSLITHSNVDNEESLQRLCYIHNWRKSWVGQFRNDIEDYGYKALV